ncbi:hypothetical protein GGF32_008296 [Allomyces javanicus]|nr:hypothetical protein GGF32_008296 [Allomyces javanicus]
MLLEDLSALGWDPDGPADAIDDGAQLDANITATLPADAPQLLEKLPHVVDLVADYVRFAPDAYADVWRHLGPLLHAISKHARAHQALHLPLPHQAAHAPPPLAPKRAYSTTNCHGDEWTDDFRWLHDRTNPEVLDYIARENEYTRDCLERPTAALRTQLVREFIDRIDENERTAEVALPDGWTYYSRKVAGHEYRQHVRYRAAAAGGAGVEEEVYLDENELAAMPEYADGAYFRVGFLRHSPCGRFIAFGIDGAGNERFTIFFKDLHRRVLLPDRLHDCWENFEFSHDGKWGFYLALDSTERAFQVRRHRLGDTDAAAHDQVLYQEDDDMYFLTLTKTCNSRFVLVHAGAQITSETWALDLDEVATATVWVPADEDNEGSEGAITSDTAWVENTVTAPGLAVPRRLIPRREGVQYTVEAHGDLLYVLTDEGVHKNNWLFRVPMASVLADAEALTTIGTESADDATANNTVDAHCEREVVIPPRDFVLIEDFQVRQNHLVVFERSNCIQNVRVIDLRDTSLQTFHYVSFSETVYSLWPMSLDEEISDLSKHVLFATNVVRYTYTSFLQPKQIVDYHMDERTFMVVHTETVAGAAGPYNPDLYAAHRLFAIGEDGTAVPMSVVYRKDLLGRPLPGSRVPVTSDNDLGPWTNPTLVHAYGAYGSCVTPIFSTQRLSLLDRGFVYAIAHVRGGADLGMAWYDEGKLGKKPNTIKDFVRCLHHLVKEGYTTPAQLAIYGRSAGGLLMGAVLNEAPGLIQACLMEVPFVDVVNTMFDASLPWTAFEYTEWGNPAADRTIYDVMRSYCPYTNVAPRETYPHVMVCGGMNDPRVSFFEPVKFVAKLRHNWQSDNLLLLRIDDAGHGGNSGQYAHLDDLAQEYAFLIYALGAPLMPVPPPVVVRGDMTPVVVGSRPGSVARSASFAGGRASPTPGITLESVSPRRSRTLSHRRHEPGNAGLDVPRGGVVRRARSPDPAAAAAAEIDAREYKSKTARGDRGVSRVYQWVANFF